MFFKELQQVEVLYSIALLQQGVEREKITGVGIFYLRERAILAFLDVAIGDGHGHLDIGVVFAFANDEVAFQLADAPDAYPKPLRF